MVKRETVSEATQGDPADEIVLVGFAPAGGSASSLSPFTSKVETLLRMAGLPYKGVSDDIMKLSPKKKFPVLRHGDNIVTDSSFIVHYLKNTYPEALAAFTPDDPTKQAIAHTAKRTLEEHYAWVLTYHNWLCDEHWDSFSHAIFKGLPRLLWLVVPGKARAQGLGRFSYEDVLKRGREDLAALSQIMGSQDYLTGDTATEADCSLFGFLDCALSVAGSDTSIEKMLRDFPNLVAFHDRVKAKYYGEDCPSKLVHAKS